MQKSNEMSLFFVENHLNVFFIISVTSVAFRPDGIEFAVSSLDGHIRFWNADTFAQNGSIEGKRDLLTGRRSNDLVTAKQLMSRRCFTSLCYSADGKHILAGGKSKYICLYHIKQEVMLRRYQISNNLSLDGMGMMLNKKKGMTEAGPKAMLDLDQESDDEDRRTISLPGVKKGDMSSRRVQPEIQTKSLRFSPAGRSWAAATTEGLLIFSLDGSVAFQPEGLDIDVTPERIFELSESQQHSKAMNYAFRLNEERYLLRVIENIKIDDIGALVQGIPQMFLEKIMVFVSKQLESSPHLEYYLTWCKHILYSHGPFIKSNSRSLVPALRSLQKQLAKHTTRLNSLCDSNINTLQYLLALPVKEAVQSESGDELSEQENSIKDTGTDNDVIEQAMEVE